jgi:hypothetical protein
LPDLDERLTAIESLAVRFRSRGSIRFMANKKPDDYLFATKDGKPHWQN